MENLWEEISEVKTTFAKVHELLSSKAWRKDACVQFWGMRVKAPD